jgi:hypothetical protein
MTLTQQNQTALKKAGLPVTAENLYMMHQLGPSAATEVIRGAATGKTKADMSASTQKAMNLNYGANSKTAADYIGANKKALDDRYASVTKGAGGASPASPAPAAPAAPAASAKPATPAVTAKPATPAVTAKPAAPALPVGATAPAIPSVVASVSAPAVPSMPSFPPVPEAPPTVEPLASNGSNRPVQVAMQSPDAGQDLRDRGIAHIVTGGLSSTGGWI